MKKQSKPVGRKSPVIRSLQRDEVRAVSGGNPFLHAPAAAQAKILEHSPVWSQY